MALLVDGSSPSLEELERYEGAITKVADTEGIDLGAKMQAARDEITTEVVKLVTERGACMDPSLWATQIVLTEPLRRWLALESIAAVYREARFGQVADRYGAKWSDYSAMAYRAKRDLLSSGLGITGSPLRKPAKPGVAAIGGTVASGSYFVRISVVNSAGAESESSDPVAYTLASAGGLRVSLALSTYGTATGWNVYLGQVESEMMLQNSTPLGLQASWDFSTGLPVAGRAPGNGQNPDNFIRIYNGLARG